MVEESFVLVQEVDLLLPGQEAPLSRDGEVVVTIKLHNARRLTLQITSGTEEIGTHGIQRDQALTFF